MTHCLIIRYFLFIAIYLKFYRIHPAFLIEEVCYCPPYYGWTTHTIIFWISCPQALFLLNVLDVLWCCCLWALVLLTYSISSMNILLLQKHTTIIFLYKSLLSRCKVNRLSLKAEIKWLVQDVAYSSTRWYYALQLGRLYLCTICTVPTKIKNLFVE